MSAPAESIQYKCPACNRPLRAKAELAGMTLTCPKCSLAHCVPPRSESAMESATQKHASPAPPANGGRLTLRRLLRRESEAVHAPAPGETVQYREFPCEHCGQHIKSQAKSNGRPQPAKVCCPRCGQLTSTTNPVAPQEPAPKKPVFHVPERKREVVWELAEQKQARTVIEPRKFIEPLVVDNKREAEERNRKEAEAKAQRAAEERDRKEAEAKAQREAKERARRQAEAKAQERDRKEAEAKAQREAKERARREAEAKAQREAQERARQEAEAKAQREAEERARIEAEQLAQREAAARARIQAEEQSKREAKERARIKAAEKSKREEEARALKQAEKKAKREAEKLARLAAEEMAKRKAEAHARKQAEDRARREEEAKAQREAEDLARKQAEEKALREAEELVRKQAEEQALREAEELARKQAEEKAQREAEESARREAEKQAKLAAQARALQEEADRIEREKRDLETSEGKARFARLAESQGWNASDHEGLRSISLGTICHNRFGNPIPHVLAEETGASLLGIPVTLDLYAKNAYRYFGIPAGLPSPRIKQSAGEWNQTRGGRSPARIAVGYDQFVQNCPAGEVLDQIKSASHLLVRELFWPHHDAGVFDQIREARSLAVPGLLGPLQEVRENGSETGQAMRQHAAAVIAHNTALLMECGYAAGHDCAPKPYWDMALGCWRDVLESEAFWRAITRRAKEFQLGEKVEPLVRALQDDLPIALLSIHCRFVQLYTFTGRPAASQRHLAQMSRSGLGGEHLEPILEELAQAAYGGRATEAWEASA